MTQYITYNGRLLPAEKPILEASNRGFRYGDGVFETIKLVGEMIINETLHFNRLFDSIRLLDFQIPVHFNPSYLAAQVRATVKKNGHQAKARVRLSVFRGNGGLFDPENHQPNFLIESFSIEQPVWHLNENGLQTGNFLKARKAQDAYSHLKSMNFLIYAMAAIDARKRKLNDCLILNHQDRVCESAISNIFLINNEMVQTPPLSEGCVAGVMRQFLIDMFKQEGIGLIEKSISDQDMQDAQEIFLTNAMGIRWIGNHEGKKYSLNRIREIHQIAGKYLFNQAPTF